MLKILSECKSAGLPVQVYAYDLSGFVVNMTGKPPRKIERKVGGR